MVVSFSPIDEIPFTAVLSLKRLRLPSLSNLTSVSAIRWDQLVELDIENTQTVSIAVDLIQRCPRLELLSLSVMEDEDEDEDDGDDDDGDDDDDDDDDGSLISTPQHDTLRSLYLNYPRAYINAVTDCFTLPALTDMSLRACQSISKVEAKSCCSGLVDFFTRSHCGLQEFELDCYGIGPDELLECLSHQSCQTLTRLVINQCASYPRPMVDRELVTHLTYPDVDDDVVPLRPKLVHLVLIKYYSSDRSFPDLLGKMIQSRCFGRAHDAQLRSLSLRLSDSNSASKEDFELLLFAQSNGGLDFDFKCLSVIPGCDGGTGEDMAETSMTENVRRGG